MGELLHAMKAYADGKTARFHMPGHKGYPLSNPVFGGISAFDLTEIDGLDSLYHAAGVIRQTEWAYAKLYGSADCYLSAGGSTLCIQAMLALALSPGDKLLASRGTHISAVNTMALLDLHPRWILPPLCPVTGLPEAVTSNQVEEGLGVHSDVKAVYITSPTIFGAMADIGAIAKVCKQRGVPLLVDNAHGAHLAFFSPSRHPIALGASLCCDSLHKTLPVLTGGAILHVGDERYTLRAREKLSLFGSTSPSYLILGSIDGALEDLESGKAAREMARAAARLEEIRQRAEARGYLTTEPGEPLRMMVGAAPLGYTGQAFSAHLRAGGVQPEYAGGGFCLLMASAQNTDQDFARLESALESLPARLPVSSPKFEMILPERVLSPREATFARQALLNTEEAPGRVAGALVAPCPPGIALAAPGELIDNQLSNILKNYGISKLSVVE